MNILKFLLSDEDNKYFAELTEAVTNACKLSNASETVISKYPCQLKFDPVKPGGVNAYPAVWTQDFTMIYAAGFLPVDVGLAHLRLILSVQNGLETRQMNTGAAIPPWAIADHVNFDGSPVFFPGTYSSGSDQGGDCGLRPPYNNYFDVIWLAHLVARKSSNPRSLLMEPINEISCYERLKNAFAVPPVDSHGIVYTTAKDRAVGFIFCDTIHMTGSLLMATLLRKRAAGHMRDLALIIGNDNDAAYYAGEVDRSLPFLYETFVHESGWLKACTGLSAQPDVFGTLYALYLNAFDSNKRLSVANTIFNALDLGHIDQNGALRHVPINHNYSNNTAWESTNTPNESYQNGGYWFMPAGWLVKILYDYRPAQAKLFMKSYIDSMRREDFRKGDSSAPWEWIFDDKRSVYCPVFGPSVTLPYAVLADYV